MNAMSSQISIAPPARSRWRAGLFVACLAVVWISLHPFDDLSKLSYADLDTGREFSTYAVFACLAAICLVVLNRTDSPALRALAVPANLALMAWIGVSIVTSTDVSTSFKRATLLLAGFGVAASLFLLPRDRHEFTSLLMMMAGLVLGLCYFGIFAWPDVSIHHSSDVVEARLEGDWRGLFAHKNAAAGVCSMFVFVGLYVWRSGRRLAGAAIAILAGIFVVNAGGKSSMALCVVTIVVSLVVERWVKLRWLQAAVLITPLALLLAVGVGSALSPAIAGLTSGLPIDDSFTGREDIWRFAIEQIADRPLFGHGLAAFWSTDAVRLDGADTTIWAREASHAHNSYLDAALTMGLPGMALVAWAFVLQPLRDYHFASARYGQDELPTLMLRIWIFGVYLSAFDAVLLQHSDPIWITFLFAVFSLRYLACFKVASK